MSRIVFALLNSIYVAATSAEYSGVLVIYEFADYGIAFWNRFLVAGVTASIIIDIEPALSPKTVMLSGLPPLTLQPIVENAVKHGMDPEYAPLHISIRTCETNSGNEIVLEDNGSGFELDADNKAHIALTNIRQRLEMMCGGKLTIRPRKGGGTVVIVTIP